MSYNTSVEPYILNLIDNSILYFSFNLRKIVLIIILIKAGLSLDINDFKKVGSPVQILMYIMIIRIDFVKLLL
ncbi:hypothetical protein IM33_02775 [Clostridioides difficile]|nr:hypothetical protein IM33_02775 [Clostridioides difficile]